MENDNTLTQMESFDFSGPVKVTIIFEDSDEDEGPPSKVIKKEISDEYNEEESKIKIINDDDDKDSVIKELDTHVTRNIITKNKTSSEQNVLLLKNQTEHLPNNDKLDCSDSKKTCSSSSIEGNSCREISNSDNSDNSNNIKCSDTIVKKSEVIPVLQEKDDKTSQNDDPNVQMDNQIKNLLNVVSDHLILIIEAYNHHLRLLYDNRYDQQKVDDSLAHWLRLKLHLFNLSYCTVSVIILPQLKNDNFNKTIINDIIKTAKIKKGMNIPYQQISDLYYEMIRWTIGKQAYIPKLPTILQATNTHPSRNSNAILKQHLNKPPMELNCTKITNGQKDNDTIAAFNEMFNNFSNGAPKHTLPPCPRSTIEPPKCTFVPSQYNHALSERDRENSLNPSTFRPIYPAHNNLSKPSMNIESSRTTLHSYRHATSNTRNPATKKNLPKRRQAVNKPELKETCIFPSGPPGSVNIPHDTLNRNRVQANFNNAGSNLLTAQKRKNLNYSINNNYVEQGRTESYGRQPDLYEQRIPTSQQMQTNHSNAVFQSTVPPPPPYFTVPARPPCHSSVHYQNQMPVFPEQDCSDKQPTQEFQNELMNQQNGLEYTRSVSTDSGFTSPLHFSNATEGTTNALPHEEHHFEPMITHVTSLNPNASFINEGQCHQCGKLTMKMCLACFRSYYCSPQCQKEDWSFHQNICKQL